jgi:hypothetical protein
LDNGKGCHPHSESTTETISRDQIVSTKRSRLAHTTKNKIPSKFKFIIVCLDEGF